MERTLRLLGVSVFLPLGIIWLLESLGMIHGNGHWEWPFRTTIDTISMQDDQLVPLDYVQVHQFYTMTHTLPVTGSNIFHVTSHHMMNCLGAWLLIPIKTCSSDQTVTPLIREVSDWRLRRQTDDSFWIQTHYYKIGMWHMITWPNGLIFWLNGLYFHFGCELWNWIPNILDMFLEIGFLRTLEKCP